MYGKYLALAWAQSKCSINTSPYSFLLLICLQGSTTLGFLKVSTSGKVKAPCLWEEGGIKAQEKGVKQNYWLTGTCAVALYWFYIRVSLPILSGACKCEIGKRHRRTAISHCTGDIKGEAGGIRWAREREKTREAERIGR